MAKKNSSSFPDKPFWMSKSQYVSENTPSKVAAKKKKEKEAKAKEQAAKNKAESTGARKNNSRPGVFATDAERRTAKTFSGNVSAQMKVLKNATKKKKK